MFQKILVIALKLVLQYLDPSNIDAEAQKQLDDYKQQRADQDNAVAQSNQELEKLQIEEDRLSTARSQIQINIASLEAEIQELDEKERSINDEKNKKLANLRNANDDDLLHSQL